MCIFLLLFKHQIKHECDNYTILMCSTSDNGPKIMCSSLFQDTRHWKRDARPPMRAMHRNSSVVDCCCLEIRGEGVWVVDFCLQTHPILVVFWLKFRYQIMCRMRKMRSDRANNEQECRHWQCANGFGFNIGENWARGCGELANRSKSSSCEKMKFSVNACFSASMMRALRVDVSNKSNTNYVFDAALSRGGLCFLWFWA